MHRGANEYNRESNNNKKLLSEHLLEMWLYTQIIFVKQTADSGVYICRADEYNGYPGSEVRVTLEVESARKLSHNYTNKS